MYWQKLDSPIVSSVRISISIINLIVSVDIARHLTKRTAIAPESPATFSELGASRISRALLNLVMFDDIHTDDDDVNEDI